MILWLIQTFILSQERLAADCRGSAVMPAPQRMGLGNGSAVILFLDSDRSAIAN